jgi:hypothetical protein
VALAVAGPLRPPLARAATSFGYRVQYWRATMHLIADFPWVGCGPGNFQNTYTRYKLPEAVEEVADPHNFLLEVWATAGTPAMLALLAVLGCFAVTVYGPRQGSRHTPCACYVPAGEDRPVPWRFSLLGMTAGFVLALPLGRLSPAAPAAIAVLLGLPVAAGCLALLSGWVRQGQFPPRLAGLGVGVLLVDLLATGGIALPGIAESFWLLVALGLAGDPVRRASRGAAMAALWLLLAASVGCYATAYAPVLGCQGWLGRARQDLLGGRWAEAQRDLELAAAADPLSAEPHWQLAAAFLEDWLTRPDDQCYRRFEEQDAAAVRLAPQSAAGWLASGDRYQRAYRKNDRQGHPLQPGAIQEAVARYGRAVELYPTSPLCRARLALARQMAGRGS